MDDGRMTELASQISLTGTVLCDRFEVNKLRLNLRRAAFVCVRCSALLTDHTVSAVTDDDIAQLLAFNASKDGASRILPPFNSMKEGSSSRGYGAVYLGAFSSSVEPFVSNRAIEWVVNCSNLHLTVREDYQRWARAVEDLERGGTLKGVLRLGWADEPDQKLWLHSEWDQLVEAVQFISRARSHCERERKGNIVIHCAQGKSRSTTVVIAYLAIPRADQPGTSEEPAYMTVQEALAFVRQKRLIAEPNRGFLEQLLRFERSNTLKQLRRELCPPEEGHHSFEQNDTIEGEEGIFGNLFQPVDATEIDMVFSSMAHRKVLRVLDESDRNLVGSCDEERKRENERRNVDTPEYVSELVFTFEWQGIEIYSTLLLPYLLHNSLPSRGSDGMAVVSELCDTVLPYDVTIEVLSIGMVSLTWCYMAFASRRIRIHSRVSSALLQALTRKNHRFGDTIEAAYEAVWEYWRTTYPLMLAEYAFLNDVRYDVELVVDAPVVCERDATKAASDVRESPLRTSNISSVVVPVGGGKDSLVVWDMITGDNREEEEEEEEEVQRDVVLVHVCDGREELMDAPQPLRVLQAMKERYYILKHSFPYATLASMARPRLQPTGHPWAALVVFDAALCCRYLNSPRVAVGFEQSANEGNGVFTYSGIEVNHQYDKSAAFVSATQRYISLCFPLYQSSRTTRPLRLDSPVSHLNELEIAEIFCHSRRLEPFRDLFLSCNQPKTGDGVKNAETCKGEKSWCCECEKCAFVFLILSAFLRPSEVSKIFRGRNLLHEPARLSVFLSLVGAQSPRRPLTTDLPTEVRSPMKPFECIGTRRESRDAVRLVCGRYSYEGLDNPVVLQALQEAIDTSPVHIR